MYAANSVRGTSGSLVREQPLSKEEQTLYLKLMQEHSSTGINRGELRERVRKFSGDLRVGTAAASTGLTPSAAQEAPTFSATLFKAIADLNIAGTQNSLASTLSVGEKLARSLFRKTGMLELVYVGSEVLSTLPTNHPETMRFKEILRKTLIKEENLQHYISQLEGTKKAAKDISKALSGTDFAIAEFCAKLLECALSRSQHREKQANLSTLFAERTVHPILDSDQDRFPEIMKALSDLGNMADVKEMRAILNAVTLNEKTQPFLLKITTSIAGYMQELTSKMSEAKAIPKPKDIQGQIIKALAEKLESEWSEIKPRWIPGQAAMSGAKLQWENLVGKTGYQQKK